MFETTEGFILHRTVFRNTSYIVDILTRRFGRMSFMARGARGEKSQFLGTLEFLNKISLTFRYNEAADVQTLRTVDVLSDAFFLAENPISYELAGDIVGLLRKVVPENEPHEDIFESCDTMMKGFRAGKAKKAVIFTLIRIADSLGWTLTVPKQCECNHKGILTWLDIRHGTFCCEDCHRGMYAGDLAQFITAMFNGTARDYALSDEEFLLYRAVLKDYFEVHTR